MLDLPQFKEKYNYNVATPMMMQYLDIKFAHQNALVLFRMGDFYELFFDDAITASNVLGLALAKRGKHGEDALKMCGVPYHALESYLHKLVEEGYVVAICEQLESPEEAKKRGYKSIVKRDVVRIITQGTITEESILAPNNPNYLISIKSDSDKVSICYLDISTSEINVISVDLNNIGAELVKLTPKEIIISDKDANNDIFREIVNQYRQKLVVQVESYFSVSKCQKIIESFYNITSCSAIGHLSNSQISVIGAVLEYVNITQKQIIPDLPLPHIVNSSDFMVIDASTRRNLELTSTVQGNYKGSLLSVIDHTITRNGRRLLYQYLSSPLTNKKEINLRHDITEFFFKNIRTAEKIREILKEVSDLDRIVTRISLRRCLPRDLLAISNTLNAVKKLRYLMVQNKDFELPDYIKVIFHALGGFDEINQIISEAIDPSSPNSLSEGRFINKSYHPKLSELYNLLHNNNEIIEGLKKEYQEHTSIDNLKICHNNILGLFIEITPKNIHKMTDDVFIHRQTIASAVRFTTKKLQELETSIISAKTLAIGLEQEIFWKICNKIMEIAPSLRSLAHNLSMVDVFCSFAYLAYEYKYSRPEIIENNEFVIKNGRHTIVEQNIKTGKFIPNSCDLNHDNRLWLLTGPNMAGKSTFLRQNALIIILAQIGSFVPAESAKIGIVDRLFSRIGAADDLAKGQSTFMVEMLETSTILAQSTPSSFIILDEIGRGTSTYDGVSIAWACLEHIHNKLKCRSLFATHYHELTALSSSLHSLKNYTINIKEENGEVLFLHQIIPGTADKSYGIHVAEIAGLPGSVIKRAYEVLRKLEKTTHAQSKNIDSLMTNNYSFFEEISHAQKIPSNFEKAFIKIDPDNLSPKEALEELYKLKKIYEDAQ